MSFAPPLPAQVGERLGLLQSPNTGGIDVAVPVDLGAADEGTSTSPLWRAAIVASIPKVASPLAKSAGSSTVYGESRRCGRRGSSRLR